jgi:XTP/dITP diphosphohydrolase
VRLLIATTNAGKIREFREMLGGDCFQWDDLSAHANLTVPEETGRTFRANACLKATHYARLLNTWSLADDSGLEVDALNNSPGVHSARWAEQNHAGHGDVDNNALLLRQLDQVPEAQRTARFVCVLALSDPQGRIILTARDTVEGRIIRTPRGSNGFGYDPLFLIDEVGRTTAELPPEEKHHISHRGRALRRLRELMGRLPLIPSDNPVKQTI